MPDAHDDVSIRIRLRDAMRFKRDADMDARALNNVGDQASKAGRKLARFNAASSKTRVNFGPFSTSMRGGALAVGAMALATGRLTPMVLGAAEATATLAGGGAAAGGVGLLAIAQGAGVAKLGISDLTDALGGNQAALKRLDPEMRGFFDTLHAKQQRLQRTASSSMLPGLAAGGQAATRNFGILNRLVGRTGRTIGGLGSDAGQLLGSAGFGADLGTVGNANVKIIDNLGHAAIFAGDGFRHIAVEAAPLAVWLSKDAREGAQLVDVWLENARASGEMAHFFREARTDMSLLGSAGGHTGRGLINLFGAQDVDGTNTLRNLDRLTARFERWTNLASTQRNAGDAIVAEIPHAVGAVMTAIANNLPAAGGTAAKVFLEGFIHADVWGKLLAGGWLAKKLGLFGLGKNLGGRLGGPAGALMSARGSTIANPLFVAVVNDMPGGKPEVPGKPGGGPSWWKTLLGGAAARAPGLLKTGGAVGAALAAGSAIEHGLGLSKRLGPMPGDAFDNARSIIDQIGRGPLTSSQVADQRARVRAVADQMRSEFAGPPIHVEARFVADGKELGRASAIARARRNARRAGG